MQHKAFGGAIGPLGEPKSVEQREGGFDDAVTFVEPLFTSRGRELIASTRRHEVNSTAGKLGFEVFTEVALVRRDDGVAEGAEQTRCNFDIVLVRASQQHFTQAALIIDLGVQTKAVKPRLVGMVVAMMTGEFCSFSSGAVNYLELLRVEMLFGCPTLSTKPLDR